MKNENNGFKIGALLFGVMTILWIAGLMVYAISAEKAKSTFVIPNGHPVTICWLEAKLAHKIAQNRDLGMPINTAISFMGNDAALKLVVTWIYSRPDISPEEVARGYTQICIKEDQSQTRPVMDTI